MPTRPIHAGYLRASTRFCAWAPWHLSVIACRRRCQCAVCTHEGRTNEFAVRTALAAAAGASFVNCSPKVFCFPLAALCWPVLCAVGASVILAHMPPDVAKFVAGWKDDQPGTPMHSCSRSPSWWSADSFWYPPSLFFALQSCESLRKAAEAVP